jgi:hypothetical protein
VAQAPLRSVENNVCASAVLDESAPDHPGDGSLIPLRVPADPTRAR